MNPSSPQFPFSLKEKDFIKWHLDQQKQIYKILILVLSPFVTGAFIAIIYVLKDKIKWFDTMDYVVLIGGLTVIALLVFVAVRMIYSKIKFELPMEKISFSGVYQKEKVGSVITGVDTFTKASVVVHKIGDYIFSASETWEFKEGDFYEVEAAPIKFSKLEAKMYGSDFQYLLLSRKCENLKLDIDTDIDLGLLKTRTAISLAILVLSIILYVPGFLAYSISTNELLNEVLIGGFVVLTSICLGAMLKLLKQRKIKKGIRAYHKGL